jgi:prophage regulatory protein
LRGEKVAKPKTSIEMQQASGRPADLDAGFPSPYHYRTQHRAQRAADSGGESAADDPDAALRLEKFLPLPVVIEVTGLAKPTIYRAMAEGRFPRQVKLEAWPGAKRSVSVWLEREVIAWQQAHIAHRDELISQRDEGR